MEVYCEIFFQCNEDTADAVNAELAFLGYEGMWEHDGGISAYIPFSSFDRNTLEDVFQRYAISSFRVEQLQPVNWNSEWEKNYRPVEVDDMVYVRAPFHPPKAEVKFDLVIQPKMSFGTGHHETTKLVIKQMLELDFTGKTVLDMGCGTGILAILASKLGAGKVYAIDHEEWAYLNTLENAAQNGVNNLVAAYGEKEQIPDEQFDVILSNITKNINLDLIPLYAGLLTPGAELILSGFYESDLEEIKQKAGSFKLEETRVKKDNNWVSVRFKLQT